MLTKYRIVVRHDCVLIEEYSGFFWKSWNYLKRCYYDSNDELINYKSVEAAQAEIDRLLAIEAAEQAGPTIINYPS